MQTIKEKISANIAKYRKKENLSQKDLAAKLQTKPSTVSSWEQGVSTPNAEMIVEMCNLFHISVDLMYGMSLADTKKSIESETIFWDYLLTLGYEVHESPYNDKWVISIKESNTDIYISNEEMNTLESTTKENIDLRITKYMSDGKHSQ